MAPNFDSSFTGKDLSLLHRGVLVGKSSEIVLSVDFRLDILET